MHASYFSYFEAALVLLDVGELFLGTVFLKMIIMFS